MLRPYYKGIESGFLEFWWRSRQLPEANNPWSNKVRINSTGLNELLKRDCGFYMEYFKVLFFEYKETVLMLSTFYNNLVNEAFAKRKDTFRNGIWVSLPDPSRILEFSIIYCFYFLSNIIICPGSKRILSSLLPACNRKNWLCNNGLD